MTTSVRSVLDQKEKGSKIHSVTSDVSVFQALTVMADNDIGGLLIVDGGRLVGIFTERDYARKVVLKGLVSRDVTVGELMTANVCTITPSHTVDEVMNIMTENRFRHLPVVDHGQLIGIVTIGDLVKSIVTQQQATIQHLSSYIAGDLATDITDHQAHKQ